MLRKTMPEGYAGPAFRLKDGRVLFVGRPYAGIETMWAVLYFQTGCRTPLVYRSPATAIVETREAAEALLNAYGRSKGLEAVPKDPVRRL